MQVVVAAALLKKSGDGEAAAALYAMSGRDLDPGDLWCAAVALAAEYVPERKAQRFALAMSKFDAAT